MARVNLGQQALLDYIQRGLDYIGQRARGPGDETRLSGSPSVLDLPGAALRSTIPATEQEALESTVTAPAMAKVPVRGLYKAYGDLGETGVQTLMESTAQGLRALPRYLREKITKAPAGSYKAKYAPQVKTAQYSPLTGEVRMGAQTLRDLETAVSSGAHEWTHAENLGSFAKEGWTPDATKMARARLDKEAGKFLSINEQANLHSRLVDLGYEPRQFGTEVQALASQAGAGPIYRRGEGGPRLWDALGHTGSQSFPAVSPKAAVAFQQMRRQENKALEAAHKLEGAQRARGITALQKAGMDEAEVQQAITRWKKARTPRYEE